MLKFQKKLTSSCCAHAQENVPPDAGQNPCATKIPLPLRAGDIECFYVIKSVLYVQYRPMSEHIFQHHFLGNYGQPYTFCVVKM